MDGIPGWKLLWPAPTYSCSLYTTLGRTTLPYSLPAFCLPVFVRNIFSSTTVSSSPCSFVLVMILDDESEPAQPTFRRLRGNLTILFFSITIHAFLNLSITIAGHGADLFLQVWRLMHGTSGPIQMTKVHQASKPPCCWESLMVPSTHQLISVMQPFLVLGGILCDMFYACMPSSLISEKGLLAFS